jgi:hypothetical protein
MPIFKITRLINGRDIYIGYKDDAPIAKLKELQIAVPEPTKSDQKEGLGLGNAVALGFNQEGILMLCRRKKNSDKNGLELVLPAGKVEIIDLHLPKIREFQEAALSYIKEKGQALSHEVLEKGLNDIAQQYSAQSTDYFSLEAKQVAQKTSLNDLSFSPHDRVPLDPISLVSMRNGAQREFEEETGISLSDISGFYIDRACCESKIKNENEFKSVSIREKDLNFRTVHYAFYDPQLKEKMGQIQKKSNEEIGEPRFYSFADILKNCTVDESGRLSICLGGIFVRAGSDLAILRTLAEEAIREELIAKTRVDNEAKSAIAKRYIEQPSSSYVAALDLKMDKELSPINQQKNVYVCDVDYDGCLLNQQCYRGRYYVIFGSVVTQNKVLINDIIESSSTANDFIMFSGSNRQSICTDKDCADRDYSGSSIPRFLEFYAAVSNKLKSSSKKFDTYLLTDTFSNDEEGTAFRKMQADLKEEKILEVGDSISRQDYQKPYIDASEGFNHRSTVYDYSKVINIYAKVHRVASQNPHSNIIFDFYDDKEDILAALKIFYETCPQLIPANVTLRLKEYNGTQNEISYEDIEIVGKGEIDYNYHENIKTIVMKTKERKPSALFDTDDKISKQDIFEAVDLVTQIEINASGAHLDKDFPKDEEDEFKPGFNIEDFLKNRKTQEPDKKSVQKNAFNQELNHLEHKNHLLKYRGLFNIFNDQKIHDDDIPVMTQLMRLVKNIIEKPFGKDFVDFNKKLTEISEKEEYKKLHIELLKRKNVIQELRALNISLKELEIIISEKNDPSWKIFYDKFFGNLMKTVLDDIGLSWDDAFIRHYRPWVDEINQKIQVVSQPREVDEQGLVTVLQPLSGPKLSDVLKEKNKPLAPFLDELQQKNSKRKDNEKNEEADQDRVIKRPKLTQA